MSLRISLLIQGRLDLVGTILDGMDFLMAARKDLDHFLQDVNTAGDRGHRQILQEMFR